MALGQMTHLQSLVLNDNYLTDVPAAIGNLCQLSSLNLQGNRLKKACPFHAR